MISKQLYEVTYLKNQVFGVNPLDLFLDFILQFENFWMIIINNDTDYMY